MVALEQFITHLTNSGILSSGELENFLPPKASPKDVQDLARRLVQSKRLTTFQAQEIYQGRAKFLILGNYTILDKIGAGGMGQVLRAKHRRMNRIVAIKVLPQSVMQDAASVARFEREVRAASKLLHPNIVSAFDADEAQGVHFLAMEYVAGTDLASNVKNSGPLTVAKALSCILQAAKGLEFAHAHGVIHRDVKPGNLLLTPEGVVKVLDMGIARIEAAGNSATQADLTSTGAVMGTVDYMAPEQALSTKHVDRRADVYSLGCTLHYLLTGKPAYDGDSLMAKLLAHREHPIPVLRSLRPDVPAGLEGIYRKMLAKKIEDRYQSMAELAADLERLQADLISPAGGVATSAWESAAPGGLQLRIAAGGTFNSKQAGRRFRRASIGIVAAGLTCLIVLAGVLLTPRNDAGLLLVEIDEPGCIVQVLNQEGKAEITRPGEPGTISIAVDPGTHRLQAEKDGFAVFAEEFEMEPGGRQSLKATMRPIRVRGADTPAKAIGPLQDPALRRWADEVALAPAERQLEEVAKKLRELNPGFDGKLTGRFVEQPPKIENDTVTELGFVTTQVTNISPVQALRGLKSLNCDGDWATKDGQLADLSPLQGMRLSTLWCNFTQVKDLAPLRGMRLVELSCNSTLIENLDPLKTMPLTILNFGGTGVADLSPLRGMLLFEVGFGGTLVADLSPLAGMPLVSLGCAAPRVSDLSPLQGMSLNMIRIKPEKFFKGIDAIRQMKSLTLIGISYHGVREEFTPDMFWKKYDAKEFKP